MVRGTCEIKQDNQIFEFPVKEESDLADDYQAFTDFLLKMKQTGKEYSIQFVAAEKNDLNEMQKLLSDLALDRLEDLENDINVRFSPEQKKQTLEDLFSEIDDEDPYLTGDLLWDKNSEHIRLDLKRDWIKMAKE